MTGSRTAQGLQWILLGLLLQLVVSLLAPGTRYADYITMGITSGFLLSYLTVPSVGVAIGALYLAGFRSIYLHRAEQGQLQLRSIRFALLLVVAAVISTAAIFAIAFATRFDTSIESEYWLVRAALNASLAIFAGLAFFLTFCDVAKVQGRAIILLATVLGAAGSSLSDALRFSLFDLSIYAWVLTTLSLGLFLLQALKLRGEISAVTTSTTEVLASPPAR